MTLDNEALKNERGRLRFRAWHRGTREMDLLLGSFADQHIAAWQTQQLAEFAEILNEQDVDLYDWYIGRSIPAYKIAENPILKLFLAHKFKAA